MSVPLAYNEYGAGPPLVIVHGLFGSSRNWHVVAERLSDKRHVMAVDLRNHGRSPWAQPMTYSEMVDDLSIFLDARGIDRATIIGHSVGGKMAMLFALLYGQMVDALVVVDIAPIQYTHTLLPYVQAMQRVDLAECARRSDVEAKLALGVPDGELRKFLMQNLVRRDGVYAWRLHLEAIGAYMDDLIGFPATPELEYSGPTLFVSGEESDYVEPRHHDAIRSFFPHAEFAGISDAGHRVHADQPEQFMAHIRKFLERAES